MITLMSKLFKWFWQLLDHLDEKTKRLIIEAITEAFKEMLRAFYRQWKSKNEIRS
jgi:hypothetical protein